MKVGILGAGQLGMMLGEAAAKLPDVTLRYLDPASDACAAKCGEHIAKKFDDQDALAEFVEGLDVVTTEFENVPADCARSLGKNIPFYPGIEALTTAQDRLLEKTLFTRLGISVPLFIPVATKEAFLLAAEKLGAPCILKTRRMGYDGKGQFKFTSVDEALDHPFEQIASGYVLEKMVHFQRELSIIAVRSQSGEIRSYPLFENVHRNGILRVTRAPANVSTELESLAISYVTRLLESLDYVGVVALEMFDTSDGLLANEFAPRVHNTGHLTIEASPCSQFENHLRAITGLPLGDTSIPVSAAMVNIIGRITDLPHVQGAHLHMYGKAERPGRKLGHVTLLDSDCQVLEKSLETIVGLVS
jgi:5-(carboxyamino)imidazole ribonucleotide synthase